MLGPGTPGVPGGAGTHVDSPRMETGTRPLWGFHLFELPPPHLHWDWQGHLVRVSGNPFIPGPDNHLLREGRPGVSGGRALMPPPLGRERGAPPAAGRGPPTTARRRPGASAAVGPPWCPSTAQSCRHGGALCGRAAGRSEGAAPQELRFRVWIWVLPRPRLWSKKKRGRGAHFSVWKYMWPTSRGFPWHKRVHASSVTPTLAAHRSPLIWEAHTRGAAAAGRPRFPPERGGRSDHRPALRERPCASL